MRKLGFNLNLPKAKTDIKRWGGLITSSSGFVLAETIKNHDGLVVIFTPDFVTANKLEFEIKAFLEKPLHENILNFPDWEILPYDIFSPHKDIVSQRLTILNQFSSKNKGALIIPVSTALHRLCPLEYILNNTLILQSEEDVNDLNLKLEKIGYSSTNQVMEHGEFTIHGTIIDLFPMGSENPFRIDIENNKIKNIRSFDIETQKSIRKENNIKLLPAKEFPTNQDSISKFRTNWRAEFSGDPSNCQIYKDVSNGILTPGLEYYLPLFFEESSTIFDYFPSNSLIIRYENIVKAVDEFHSNVVQHYEQHSHDVKRPILKPNRLFLAVDEFFHNIKNFKQIFLQSEIIKDNKYAENFTIEKLPDVTISSNYERPLYKVQNLIKGNEAKILLSAETEGRKAILAELFIKHGMHPKEVHSWNDFLQNQESLCISAMPIENGFKLESINTNIIVITEFDVFGNKIIQRSTRRPKASDFIAGINELEELNIGTPVVHIEYGVGRYCGLQKIIVSEQEGEFVVLEYANNDKLYIPVSSLRLISRYSGADLEHAPLHTLGSIKWQKDRSKALEQVKDVAVELLSIYAKREMHKGVAFAQPDLQYATFAAKFPFEETQDQEQAIVEVIQDLTSSKPMDRIICGDVGFGKTEVAVRAAFLSVQSGKQVAVLVPTTLLAQQHYQTFIDRFANFPIRISVISRFKTSKEQDAIMNNLFKGNCDIIIGTHKLLQENVKFKNLGLLIIDEEHRFGVSQKEKFKAFRAEVNILTMTATPIPRTLNMAMSKLRDLSIIGTPPAKRLSIKTFVREYDTEIIKEAILRELRRGGQVYYLHNVVNTIEKTANLIQELVPQADVAIAHGQMPKKELEKVMFNFYRRKINVLVCTTIIETGIDIPTANTIVIERADKFGLAQLHQLRGRVGRSHHQSYAFCLTPLVSSMTPDASKRLDAISSLETLGVGFTLATHDLEIRGAGELLGEEQSGNMQAIGFNLYMELLENAINALKRGKSNVGLPIPKEIEIDLMIPALIPNNYISDVNIRLVQYKRIAMAKDENKLQELKIEMIDRFGVLPEQTKILFSITQLKLSCQKIGISKIKVNKKSGFIEFIDNPNIDAKYIIDLINKDQTCYKLAGSNSIKFYKDLESGNDRFAFVEQIIDYFIKVYRN